MIPMQMACVVFTRNQPTDIYLVRHTYELNTDATDAMQDQVTCWLLTADGRRFMREHNKSHGVSFWAAMFDQHPDVLAKAPGILAVELLPCPVVAVYEEDDTTSPWWTDFQADHPKGRLLLDKEKVQDLIERKQHAEQHG
jgi:hypothetical protein